VTTVPPAAEASSADQVLRSVRARVHAEVTKVVVGQDAALDALLISLAVGGHALLEGVPGVAKTLLASTFARSLGLTFQRAQFTPDLLPSDLTGTMTLRDRELVFRPGPVFTNVLLADEINRTPPKTQAALLEAMQEQQVTIDGESHELPSPFLVVATQNPIEHEGTYPLPEAQLDRFLVKVDVGYPSADQEQAMLSQARDGLAPRSADEVRPVVSTADVLAARAEVDATTVTDEVAGYVTALVRQTRALPGVAVGASPRAGVHLLSAARASARLWGRHYVIPDDVIGVAPIVLRHRIVLRPEAELDRLTPDAAVANAVAAVPVPR
jgi:MoxR-like ATPase